MPNGKIGDHPYTDIVVHGRRVYSELADQLVLEMSRLGDERTQRDLADRLLRAYNEFDRPDVPALERELMSLRNRLREDATRRGWEPID